MSKEEAISVLNDYDINFERNTAEEIAEAHEMAIKVLQQQPSENEKIIRIKKGTLKVRTGKYVIYDVEWLKTHFNTTEAKIYGQPNEDCISRKAVLEITAETGALETQTRVKALPSVTLQPKTEQETHVKKGHWIGHKEHCERLGVMPSGLGAYEWCSNCDYGIDIRDWSRIGHKYCPECGARMEAQE